MPFMRRRPLLRAAAVGGGAYMAGKHVARSQADQNYQDASQEQRISNLEQQQTAVPAPNIPPRPPRKPAGRSRASAWARKRTRHRPPAT